MAVLSVGVSGLCYFFCVIMLLGPQNYAWIMPGLCPGLCPNYANYAKLMPVMLKLCYYALCQNYAGINGSCHAPVLCFFLCANNRAEPKYQYACVYVLSDQRARARAASGWLNGQYA